MLIRVLKCVTASVLGAAAAYGALEMDWHAIDGGGGVSTAGTLVLSGTIGQSEPATLNGTSLSLTGGFWAATNAVSPQPGSPLPEDSLATTCTLDSQCANEAYCVDGICYVPKNRYLSVAPNAANTAATARRLSVVTFEQSCGGAGNTPCISDTECAGNLDGITCDDVATGSQVIGWFGQPSADGYAGIVDEVSRHYAVWGNLTFPIECGVDELCPAGSHCDTGLGSSNTCRLDADNTEAPSTVVQLSGCHIAPKRRDVRPGVGENRAANYYLIEAIAEGSDTGSPSNYSTPLELRTVVFWADMTGGTSGNVALPPEGSPGFLDVLQQVNRFKDKGKATTPWLDLDPQVPDQAVGFLDMLKAVGGFKDDPYPWNDPCTCSGLSPCP